MASLDDLTAATEELSAPAQMHLQPPLLCQLTFTLPGPQLLPLHQGELLITRENSPDARRNHFPLAHLCPCLFCPLDFWLTAVAYRELTKAGTLLSSLKSARGLLRCNLQPTDCSSMTRRNEQSLAHREE